MQSSRFTPIKRSVCWGHYILEMKMYSISILKLRRIILKIHQHGIFHFFHQCKIGTGLIKNWSPVCPLPRLNHKAMQKKIPTVFLYFICLHTPPSFWIQGCRKFRKQKDFVGNKKAMQQLVLILQKIIDLVFQHYLSQCSRFISIVKFNHFLNVIIQMPHCKDIIAMERENI